MAEIPPDRQDRFEQITQEIVDRWYVDSGRPELASSYKIKWPRYEDAAAFENNARALWDELGLHADDETCIAILAAALERASALAYTRQEPAPAADAEEIGESIALNLARDIRAAPSLMKATYVAERAISAALRRYADDGGVPEGDDYLGTVMARADAADSALEQIYEAAFGHELKWPSMLRYSTIADDISRALTAERQRREELESVVLMLEQDSGKTDEEINAAASAYVSKYLTPTPHPIQEQTP